jgi:hypothetical protein
VSGYAVNNQATYAAVWQRAASAPWIARHGLTSTQYHQEFNTQLANGYRLVHVSGYGGSAEKFAAIWVKTGGTSWIARHGLGAADYQQTFNDLRYQGRHPQARGAGKVLARLQGLRGGRLAQRKANEVVYYDSENPYGMNVTRMDSHGG